MSDARIADLGYQPYDGDRLGPRHAVRSVARYSIQRALGLRRPARAKVFPLLAAGIAYVPAIVFVGLAALLPDPLVQEGGVLPEYADYYGFITAAIIVFTALVGPEVLCPDRRSGLLGLYLAAPLTRMSYLAAKLLAVAPVLALVTIGPPLLLLVGLTLEGAGPDGVVDFMSLLVRVVAGGLAVALPFTSLSLAVAAFTTRRAVASAAVLILLMVSGVAADVFSTLGAADAVWLLDLRTAPFELVQRIYGQAPEPGGVPASSLPTWAVAAAVLAWTVVPAAVLALRYRALKVTR